MFHPNNEQYKTMILNEIIYENNQRHLSMCSKIKCSAKQFQTYSLKSCALNVELKLNKSIAQDLMEVNKKSI